MKASFALCLVILGCAVLGCGKSSAPPVPPPPPPPAARPNAAAGDVAEAAKGINAFAFDLYAKLAEEKKDENLFFSPYSISTALSMTYAGARGNTAAEMKKTLRFALDDAKLHPAMGALVSDLNAAGAKGEFQLSVANALWMQQGHKFLPDFLNLNKTTYGAGLETLDFVKDTEGSRKTINSWVEKQTREKIKDLILPGMVDPMTRLVLTNAIYFKGGWTYEFSESSTKNEPFTLLGGRKNTAPMMHQRHDLDYAEGRGFKVLELPYKGSWLSMIILLPDKVDGLPALEKALSPETSFNLKLSEADVILTMPKFTTSSEFRLDEALKALGMKAAFGPAADLSGMDGVKGGDQALCLSAVIHKAWADVNEKGTEAAAATGVVGEPKCEPGPPKRKKVVVFTADHPFIFLIRDRETGCVLFIGRVLNPKQS